MNKNKVMQLEEINKIIDNYKKLYDLAVAKIEVIEKLDTEYHTARGIEDIDFNNDSVWVKCDDSCMGYYDSLSFVFPTEWLTKTDLELETIVVKARKDRERLALKKQREEKKLKEKKREQEEFERYQKLKAKFENC